MTGHRTETAVLWLVGAAAAGLLVHAGTGARGPATGRTAPDPARIEAIGEDHPRWDCWEHGNRVCGIIPGAGQDLEELAEHAVAAGPAGATCWVATDRVLCTRYATISP